MVKQAAKPVKVSREDKTGVKAAKEAIKLIADECKTPAELQSSAKAFIGEFVRLYKSILKKAKDQDKKKKEREESKAKKIEEREKIRLALETARDEKRKAKLATKKAKVPAKVEEPEEEYVEEDVEKLFNTLSSAKDAPLDEEEMVEGNALASDL